MKAHFYTSLDNLFSVGIEIVRGILHDWNCTFWAGVSPSNYIGDIFGSLGGEPDFWLRQHYRRPTRCSGRRRWNVSEHGIEASQDSGWQQDSVCLIETWRQRVTLGQLLSTFSAWLNTRI